MMSWNPEQYLEHKAPRQRPAADLLARIPLTAPETIIDLGCGSGAVAPLLLGRWPRSRLIGVDASATMLARARRDYPQQTWLEKDVAEVGGWQPAAPTPLIFSNAALHWLPDHARLLPQLMAMLAPGGVLAVQMPANFDAPSHRLLREVAASGPWAALLAGVQHGGILPAAAYQRLLTPYCAAIDLWQTTYWHPLVGDDAVLTWMRGAAMRPYLARLEAAAPELVDAFCLAYRARLSAAYPGDADGTVLFPFSRLFFVAIASGVAGVAGGIATLGRG